MASIGKESAPPISSSPKYPPPTSPPPTTPPPFSLSGASTPSQPMPPELPYSLRDHKKSIAAIWTLLVIDTAVVPLVLFYSLWDDTRLRPMWIMTITTSLYGLISGFEWAYRTYVLFTRERLRPLDASKWALDFFHFAYTIGYGIGLVELITGAAPDEPLVRLCAMPAPSLILFFGSLLMLFATMTQFHPKTPFRISSQPKGVVMRPGTYMIIEDVLAVDTGVGRAYRKALSDRYEASPIFRTLLRQMDLFWGIPALLVGGVTTAVVFTESLPVTISYGVGWVVPPIWAGIWALITIKWVQSSLRKEKEAWSKESIV